MGFGKRQCRSLFWRFRAAVKKSVKRSQSGGKKKQVRFHYDPSSYALNFDDGGAAIGAGLRSERNRVDGNAVAKCFDSYKLHCFCFMAANATWVYVVLITV